MAIVTKDLYEGCLLGPAQSKPWRSTMVHLFRVHQTHPLCGTFMSGRVFSADDSCLDNPRCKSCRAYANSHFDGDF